MAWIQSHRFAEDNSFFCDSEDKSLRYISVSGASQMLAICTPGNIGGISSVYYPSFATCYQHRRLGPVQFGGGRKSKLA